jgi:hypothetical protein
MLKTILAFIAMALLVDAVAFDSYYRVAIIHDVIMLWRAFVALDWAGFLT